jgi:hypothetical protein
MLISQSQHVLPLQSFFEPLALLNMLYARPFRLKSPHITKVISIDLAVRNIPGTKASDPQKRNCGVLDECYCEALVT